MKTSFLNWIAEKELAQINENEQELTTLYHGSIIDDIKNIKILFGFKNRQKIIQINMDNENIDNLLNQIK